MSDYRTGPIRLDEDAAGPDSLDFCAIAPTKAAHATRLLASCSEPGTCQTLQGRLARSRSIVYMMAGLAWHVRFARADIGKPKMLRITVHEDGSLWRLHLAGRLAGAWVAETENTWRSAPVSGRRLEIDLREVTWIDEAGQRLLQAMNQAGACLIAKGLAMEALVEEITGVPARRRSDSHL